MTRTQEIDLAPRGGLARRLPLLAGVYPVAGALLSWDPTGYVHELVAGEAFAGICTRSVRAGGFAADGDGQVDAMTGQFLISSTGAIAGIDETDVASATVIYASDDSTLTATATSNTKIGAVAGFDGARVVIMARTADIAAADAPPPSLPGGIFGSNTLVVSEDGDDTAAALDPYGTEFATIQSALNTAAAGDAVIVRPGTYAETVVLRNNVRLHGLPGSVIACQNNGEACLWANAAVDCSVSGRLELRPTSGAHGVLVTDASAYIRVECEIIDVTNGGHAVKVSGGATVVVRAARRIDVASGINIYADDGSAVTVEAPQLNNASGGSIVGGASGIITLRANLVVATAGRFCLTSASVILYAEVNGYIGVGNSGFTLPIGTAGSEIMVKCAIFQAGTKLVQITGEHSVVCIEATQLLTAPQILVDSGSNGASYVSLKAPKIIATGIGDQGVYIDHASATAEYEITADVLLASVDNRASDVGCKLRVDVGKHRSHAGSGAPGLSVQGAAETFYRCKDLLGIASAPYAIYAAVTATLHLLGGRIRGLDGNAGGHAILTSGATCKIRLYPGVVLIAGDDAAAVSIEADNTPTVIAMGDIAANKAANVGVVVDVGSLLVDAAVV